MTLMEERMTSNSNTTNNNALPPPPPPPPEDPNSKISSFVLKLRSAPPDYHYKSPKPPAPVDIWAAPKGPYLFYGTLTDPCMLAEILHLDHEPELRPAYILGYECKLWGPYPALLDAPEVIVEGTVYNVQSVEDGETLAAYETGYYRTEPCLIQYVDGEEPGQDLGSVFKFVGDERELSEGGFDLKVWLKRMGRMSALEKLEKLETKKKDTSRCYGRGYSGW